MAAASSAAHVSCGTKCTQWFKSAGVCCLLHMHALQAHPKYNSSDVYNTCLFRVLLRNNNSGPPDAVLYDFPLGWWDHDWSGCFDSRKEINDTHWHKVASSTLSMHSR